MSCVEILVWTGAEWEAVLTGAAWALCWLNIHSPGTAHCLWDHFGFPCLTPQHSWGDKIGEDSADSLTHTPQTDKGVSEIRQTKPHSRTCSLKNRKMQPSSYWILVSWFCGFDSSFFISENSASHTEKLNLLLGTGQIELGCIFYKIRFTFFHLVFHWQTSVLDWFAAVEHNATCFWEKAPLAC